MGRDPCSWGLPKEGLTARLVPSGKRVMIPETPTGARARLGVVGFPSPREDSVRGIGEQRNSESPSPPVLKGVTHAHSYTPIHVCTPHTYAHHTHTCLRIAHR